MAEKQEVAEVSDLRGKVWTSELNSRPDIRPTFDRSRTIRFYDTTLRDGEQTVGVIFSPQQKLEIAKSWMGLASDGSKRDFPKCPPRTARRFPSF